MLGLVAMCTWILIDRTLTTHKANFDKVFYGFTAVAFLLLAEMNEYLEPRFDHFVVLAVRLLLAGVVARVTLAVLTVDDGQGSCASVMRFFKPWIIKKSSLLPTAHVQPEARDHVRVQVEPSPCAPDSAKPGRNSFKSICGKLIAILLVLIGIFAFINLVGLILHHYHNDYVLEGYDVEGSVVSIDPDCFRL